MSSATQVAPFGAFQGEEGDKGTQDEHKYMAGASKVVQQVRVFATKLGNLSSASGTRMVEGKILLPQVII